MGHVKVADFRRIELIQVCVEFWAWDEQWNKQVLSSDVTIFYIMSHVISCY